MNTVNEIMNKWYDAMKKNNVAVQPKVSTILGTILSEYEITPKDAVRDVWKEFMNVTAGKFDIWYSTLSDEEKKSFNKRREVESAKSRKQILKG